MPQTVRREHGVFPQPREAAPSAVTDRAGPDGPTAGGGLVFQRCLWCGSPAYHRSFCRTCGSADLKSGRSSGAGTVVRRYMPVVHNTFVIAMDEGFTVVCRFRDLPQAQVGAGARVRVVHAVDPLRQDLPVVELRDPAPPLPHRP